LQAALPQFALRRDGALHKSIEVAPPYHRLMERRAESTQASAERPPQGHQIENGSAIAGVAVGNIANEASRNMGRLRARFCWLNRKAVDRRRRKFERAAELSMTPACPGLAHRVSSCGTTKCPVSGEDRK
jgi:hypothetical protein